MRGDLLVRLPALRVVKTVGEKGPAYIVADQIPNFFLAKTEVFREVMWDPRIKIEYEHQDFFLTLRHTDWKAAICLDAKAVHLHCEPEREYFQYRRNASPAYFLAKHHLGGVVNQF
jgi:GT2 family glycosyltransferase